MKTIIISVVVIMTIFMTTMGFTTKAPKKNVLLIQAVHNNILPATLSESAKIISARLNDIDKGKFEVNIIPSKKQILVTAINDVDINSVENLVIQKGTIEFYRACNQNELVELLKGNNHLFSILNKNKSKNTDSRIGFTSLSKVDLVNEYINSNLQNKKCRFVWSDFSDSSKVYLYGLKLETGKRALLTGHDIDSIRCKQEKTSKYWFIDFSFKKPAIKLWSTITRQNIGNAIAIVVDNHVICAPVINSVIEGGKCSITGNFTEADVKQFAAFVHYGELPVVFKVIR